MPEIIELDKREIKRISVVCPFYNEAAIIENASSAMIANLEKSGLDWELILVNDGSTDNSLQILSNLIGDHKGVKILTYEVNQGRGYALKTGISYAEGDIIITMEIDLSWGEDIVTRIIAKFKEMPKLDVVIASPNIEGGGYKNVPLRRVLLSRIGNQLIRLLFTKKITMNTGMTRGYRKNIIRGLNTFEKGKEFHLEVLLKLFFLVANISEIPAVLTWQTDKLLKNTNFKRKPSLSFFKFSLSHINFLVFARPIRYFWFICLLFAFGSFISLLYGIYLLLIGRVSIYMAIVSLLFAIFALLFFSFGVISEQNINILKELWKKPGDRSPLPFCSGQAKTL